MSETDTVEQEQTCNLHNIKLNRNGNCSKCGRLDAQKKYDRKRAEQRALQKNMKNLNKIINDIISNGYTIEYGDFEIKSGEINIVKK